MLLSFAAAAVSVVLIGVIYTLGNRRVLTYIVILVNSVYYCYLLFEIMQSQTLRCTVS